MQLDDLLLKARRLEIRSRHLARTQFSGLYRSAFKGQGMEFAEVREYTEGDDIRLIDWNVSARSEALYVKKMVEERERSVLVVLDVSGSLAFGSVRRTKFDLMLEMAALMILSAFYARDRVSLAVVKSQVERYIPPRKGWNHAARLIREMVACDPEGRADDLEAIWSFLNSPGIPRSLVFFLSDFQAPITPSNHFSIAARKHEILFFLLSDPREWFLPDVGRVHVRNPETGATWLLDTGKARMREEFERSAHARRESVQKALAAGGVSWAEFRTDLDYEAPLRYLLESRIVRKGYHHP